MKHLSVSLIIVALVAAAFGADLWLSDDLARSWGLVATGGLAWAVIWFGGHWDD